MPLTIGITNCNKWANYEGWIKGSEEDLKIVLLQAGEGEASFVNHCDGLVLTGGEDVHPSLYGKPEYIAEYNLTDLNLERDKFEMGALKEALEYKIPILGICRGLQLANVFFNGTLIPDLPGAGKTGHSMGPEKDTVHTGTLTEDSRLYNMIGMENGKVNSHHHQAVDLPGHELIATAFSDDGVVEGMEKARKHDTEFFLLVQWHPERMDVNNPFSGKLRDAFLKACEEYNRFYKLTQFLSATP